MLCVVVKGLKGYWLVLNGTKRLLPIVNMLKGIRFDYKGGSPFIIDYYPR